MTKTFGVKFMDPFCVPGVSTHYKVPVHAQFGSTVSITFFLIGVFNGQ